VTDGHGEVINKKEYTITLELYTIEEKAAFWCREEFGAEGSRWARKVTQISGMTFIHGETFYFDNVKDAVIFKLKWVNNDSGD